MATPRVILNCATSLDGRLAAPGGKKLVLSSPEDLARVHRLRASVGGVLVGVGTVLADDPSLLVKEAFVPGVRRQPARIVLDSRARTPPSARVLDGRAPCYLVTAGTRPAFAGAFVLDAGPGERVDLRRALGLLGDAGLRSILVEGGGRVLASFLAENLADEMTVYVAPRVVGQSAPGFADGWPSDRAGDPVGLRLTGTERVGDGALLRFARG